MAGAVFAFGYLRKMFLKAPVPSGPAGGVIHRPFRWRYLKPRHRIRGRNTRTRFFTSNVLLSVWSRAVVNDSHIRSPPARAERHALPCGEWRKIVLSRSRFRYYSPLKIRKRFVKN